MPDIATIEQRRVEGGFLDVSSVNGGTKRLPVSSFVVNYAMDSIPVAQVVPATGTPVLEEINEWDSLADIGKNEAAQLYIELAGEEVLLIDGYVSSIATTDESSPRSRRMGASISIQGKAVKLAGAPSASFVYSDGNESLPMLAMKKLNVNVFSSQDSGSAASSILAIETFVSRFLKDYPQANNWPAEVLRSITTSLYAESQGVDTGTGNDLSVIADEVINAYPGCQLKALNLVPTMFLRNIGEKFANIWRQQNAWQSLLSSSKYFMMHILPFNNGFYVANPYSLDRNFDVEIKSGEYLRLAKSRNERLSEPVNGVAMRPPAGIPYGNISADTSNYWREAYVFPRPNNGNIIDGYYHFRQFPSWLYKERAWTVNKPAKGKPLSEKPDPDSTESLKEFYNTVGIRVARAIYGQLLNDQTAITINFPWRTDLMPGTRFKLINDEASDISFIGSSLHGMVTSTQFRCSVMSDSPDLSVIVQAVSVRNETDNEKDNLTYDGHPIFDDRWVGMNLDGSLLSAAPETPKRKPTETFNSEDGEVD